MKPFIRLTTMKHFRLTRFDLDAADFLASEDVAAMTAAEVGQYFLLLCAAWLGGKDATLPNNPRTLARIARATNGRVAPVVMRKFISTGQGRLSNPRLSAEWKAACARAQVRHDKAQKAATKRWSEPTPSMPQALPAACSEPAPEMPSSSSPIPFPNPEDDDHQNDDYRTALFNEKTSYLARCDGDVALIDYALTEIINRTTGPVSSPPAFFEKALANFFDEANQRDRELLQQFMRKRPMRDGAVASATLPSRRRSR
jgi:uncharacterized protein YdaU (DUF1376 family)